MAIYRHKFLEENESTREGPREGWQATWHWELAGEERPESPPMWKTDAVQGRLSHTAGTCPPTRPWFIFLFKIPTLGRPSCCNSAIGGKHQVRTLRPIATFWICRPSCSDLFDRKASFPDVCSNWYASNFPPQTHITEPPQAKHFPAVQILTHDKNSSETPLSYCKTLTSSHFSATLKIRSTMQSFPNKCNHPSWQFWRNRTVLLPARNCNHPSFRDRPRRGPGSTPNPTIGKRREFSYFPIVVRIHCWVCTDSVTHRMSVCTSRCFTNLPQFVFEKKSCSRRPVFCHIYPKKSGSEGEYCVCTLELCHEFYSEGKGVWMLATLLDGRIQLMNLIWISNNESVG